MNTQQINDLLESTTSIDQQINEKISSVYKDVRKLRIQGFTALKALKDCQDTIKRLGRVNTDNKKELQKLLKEA